MNSNDTDPSSGDDAPDSDQGHMTQHRPPGEAAGGAQSVMDSGGVGTETIRLETPGTGVRETWKAMGPGIAAAMTGIGASHIMHGPTAGAEFAYALLWVIPFAYLLKYCAFEFAHRYTIVKGETIMEAYERIGQGRGQWPLWYLAFQSLANTFGIAGRALGCGAFLWAAFPFIPLTVWTSLVLLSSVIILWAGKYAALERVVKFCIIAFAGAVIFAFVLQAPPPGDYVANLLPALPPAGALMLFGAMFGYFPTTVEVSPMQSNWAVDKGRGMVKVRQLENQGYRVELGEKYLANSFKLFKRDMNISYMISLLTGMMFLIIGAVMLAPLGIAPEGEETGLTITQMYTDIFGAWVFPIIVGGAVAALYSTVLSYFDGQARVFEECCARLHHGLFDTPKARKLIYRGFQLLWLIAGGAIVFGMPEPIFVVQVASVLALLFAPVIFFLNVKSVKDNFTSPTEREFMPSRLMFTWAWLGILGLAVVSLYFLYYQFFVIGAIV